MEIEGVHEEAHEMEIEGVHEKVHEETLGGITEEVHEVGTEVIHEMETVIRNIIRKQRKYGTKMKGSQSVQTIETLKIPI